jgi:hypothetical protein
VEDKLLVVAGGATVGVCVVFGVVVGVAGVGATVGTAGVANEGGAVVIGVVVVADFSPVCRRNF